MAERQAHKVLDMFRPIGHDERGIRQYCYQKPQEGNMKEEILALLQTEGIALEAYDIADRLNASAGDISGALESLISEGKAVATKKGRYAVPGALGLTAARITVLRNGMLMARPLDGGDSMKLRAHTRLQCLYNDIILVRPEERDGTGTRWCSLIHIVKRAHETFSAILNESIPSDPYERLRARGRARKRGMQAPREPVATAKPYDSRITCQVRLEGDLLGARNGDMVVLQTIAWPEYDKPLTARVLRVMGEAEVLPVQLKAIAEDHGFRTGFDDEIEAAAAWFPGFVQDGDIKNRRDLRTLTLFTIDGEDAKDFDDAVSLEQLPDGIWHLGVHIADVSHYVSLGQPIDQEALYRGTSLYMPGLTLPMLPHTLSDELCSLKPDVDRLAMSLLMKVRGGRIIDHELFPSVIHSRARLTYTAVNRLFSGEESLIPQELQATLVSMLEVSRDLRRNRVRRGSIDFDLSETAFTLGPDNEPLDVHARERGEAERLIEDFMLAANETVAELARNTGLPLIYRVHDKPDPLKLNALELFLSGLNVSVHLGPDPHPGVLQDLLSRTAGFPHADIIRSVMIRSLKRACYDDKPEGHYALAARDYCHFTSPIRRYPDLVVHRMLKLLISGADSASHPHSRRMAELAEHCSQREFAATLAEREADDLLKAFYMSHHIGEEYEGIVSGVTSWGFYVTLPNTVEGLVHIASLDDYYQYDERRSMLVGSRSNRVIRLGDSVRIKVARADKVRREVDFELVSTQA